MVAMEAYSAGCKACNLANPNSQLTQLHWQQADSAQTLETASYSTNFEMAPAEAKDNVSCTVPEKEMSPKADDTPVATSRHDRPLQTLSDPGDVDEGRDVYRPGGFHPVYIGDVYADKYKIMNKIGYGVYSTVWLVRDLTTAVLSSCGFSMLTEAHSDDDAHKFRALKVLSAKSYGKDKPLFEREILAHLRDGDRNMLGYKYVCHLVDDFEHQGPNGTHVCLVFELMGETLLSFGAWFEESMIPYSVMRRFTTQLILALEFAHAHNVIHTGVFSSPIPDAFHPEGSG
jgi:serine/threonine-protein kinase SRPK3